MSRYRLLWTSISRLARNYRCPVASVYKTPKLKVVLPFSLGISFFTWLGFQKETNAEDDLIDTIKHCVLFIQRTEYIKAEQLLHIALRQAQQINHQLGITYIYDVMANLALEREELDKAKQLFIAVSQRLMSQGVTEDDSRMVHISVKLARISHLKKDYETAQLGYDWCLQKLRKTLADESTQEKLKLLAMAEDWYGRLFVDCDQFEQGLKLLISALYKMREVSDVEQAHIVIQLNDIGTVYDHLGNTDESIQYFKEAIEKGKEIPEMEDLGAMYVNLGRAYLKKRLIDAARKSCGQGWKLAMQSKNDQIKNEAEQCLSEVKNI